MERTLSLLRYHTGKCIADTMDGKISQNSNATGNARTQNPSRKSQKIMGKTISNYLCLYSENNKKTMVQHNIRVPQA